MQIAFAALLMMISATAHAVALECKLSSFNDEQGITMRVTPASTAQKIGTLGGDAVLIQQTNGYTIVSLEGSASVSAGSKSDDIFLRNEGFYVECGPHQ